MTTYETKLRGARNRIVEAITLSHNPITMAKLSAIVTTLDDLIRALVVKSEDVI